MSADRQALLDALREEPDNDSLRLVYADWLEDHGEGDRAEYIRLCYERSGLDDDDPFADELDRRRRQLYRKHRRTWGPDLSPALNATLRTRGLVQSVQSTALAFLKCSDSLSNEPVSRVRLSAATNHLSSLLGSPALNGVRELTLIDSPLNLDAVQTLADSPRLAGLRTLRLVRCRITGDKVALLAASPHLANLRTLDLGHYERRDGDPNNALWRDLAVTGLENRTLNQVGDAGIIALANSPHLGRLETLLVANGWISAAAARQLWPSKHLTSLRHLDISYNYLHAEGARDLAASPMLGRLSTLEMQANEIGPEGVRALAGSPGVRRLKTLDLAGSATYQWEPLLNNEAAELLASSPHLRGLEHLNLAHNIITTKGAEALAKSTSLKSLKTLLLGNNRLGDRAARAFASSPLLKQLTLLDLTGCGVADAGARALCRSKTAGEQLSLDLLNNPLSEQAIEALRERYGERVAASPAAEEMPF